LGGGQIMRRKADHNRGAPPRRCENHRRRARLHDEIDAGDRCEGREDTAEFRVNTSTTQSTRTITWQASLGAVCTAGFSLSTDDQISSVTTLPMPTLNL